MQAFDFSQLTHILLEDIRGGDVVIIDTNSLQNDPKFATSGENKNYQQLLPNTLYSIGELTKQSFDLCHMAEDKDKAEPTTIVHCFDDGEMIFNYMHIAQDLLDLINPTVVFEDFRPIYDIDEYYLPQVMIDSSKITKPFGPFDNMNGKYLINNGHMINSRDLYCVYDQFGYLHHRLLLDQSRENGYNLTHFFDKDLKLLEGVVYSAQEIFDKYIFTS